MGTEELFRRTALSVIVLPDLGTNRGTGHRETRVTPLTQHDKPTRERHSARDATRTKTNCFSANAHDLYRSLAGPSEEPDRVPFLLLEVKSLPRSGIHYMKLLFEAVLGDRFSFCEWYLEPGCCRRMPCALLGYAEESARTGEWGLRMTKSHDFYMADPTYPPLPSVRRIILVRDPVFVLTSWFALDTLRQTNLETEIEGFSIAKVDFKHEPAIVSSAFRALNNAFEPPSPHDLEQWLSNQQKYAVRFIEKWGGAVSERTDSLQTIVQYDDVSAAVVNLLDEFRARLTSAQQERLDALMRAPERHFNPRSDPFWTPAPRLSAYLREHADLFRQAGHAIVDGDRHQVFATPSSVV